MSRSKVSSWPHVTYYLDGISLPDCAMCQSSQNTNIDTSSCSPSYHRPGRINLPDKNKSETARLELPAVELTFLRWTEILFYVTVNSGGARWWATMGKTTSFTILQENFETELSFVLFPNVECCHLVLRREEGTFRCLNSINGEWRDTV